MSSQQLEFKLAQPTPKVLAALIAIHNQTLEGVDFPAGLVIEVQQGAEQASLLIEAASSAEFEFFDGLYEHLCSLDAQFEVAKLFASSTGTTHFWESSLELDIEFDEKRIVFLLKDQDDIEEMLEQIDEPELQQSVQNNTQLVIISDDEAENDQAQLVLAKSLNIPIITEEHFWECQAFC